MEIEIVTYVYNKWTCEVDRLFRSTGVNLGKNQK